MIWLINIPTRCLTSLGYIIKQTEAARQNDRHSALMKKLETAAHKHAQRAHYAILTAFKSRDCEVKACGKTKHDRCREAFIITQILPFLNYPAGEVSHRDPVTSPALFSTLNQTGTNQP